MPEKKTLLIIWLLAVLLRMGVLSWVKDMNYVGGMAQGELAYAIATGKGIAYDALPGCGIVYVQNAQNRLIDVQDYLKNYPIWCEQIGLKQKPPQEISENPFPTQMPGMGILLAGTFFLFGQHRYIYLQVIVLLLDSLGILMLFWIGKTWFGKAVGYISAILYAIYLPGIRISAAGGIRDAWMPILFTTCLYLFLKAYRSDKHRAIWFILTGLCVGIGVYLRPDVLFLPVFMAGLLWLTQEISLREALKVLSYMVLPVIILLTPWWIRNYTLYDRFMLTSPQLGGTMWEAFGEFDQPGQRFWRLGNPFGAVYDDAETHAKYIQEGGQGGFFSQEYLTHFNQKVKNAILSRPDWYALLLLRRIVEIPVMGFDWDVGLPLIFSTKERILISRGFSLFLFGAAGLGILFKWRDYKAFLIILSVVLYSWAIHIPISINGRYLFPAYAGLIVLAAVGIQSSFLYFLAPFRGEKSG